VIRGSESAGISATLVRMPATQVTRPRRSRLFDLMIAGLVVLLSVLPIFSGRQLGLTSLIGVAMAAALLVRRRYPLSVMAVVSLLGLLQVLAFAPANDPMPYDIAILIAMYSVVKYSRTLWHGYLAAVPVVIGIVVEIDRHINRRAVYADPVQIWTEAVAFLAALCAAVWLTGYTVRTRRLYVVGLEERAATAERERDHLATIAVVEERASIARDLHDVVAHSMAVMIVQADGATYALDSDPEQAKLAIKQVATTGRDALEDMRRLVGVLRGTTVEQSDDTTDRRRIGLDQLTTVVDRARSAGLTVTVDETGTRHRIPTGVELTVFRIVQEALTNVLRHAGPAAAVTIRLRYGPNVVDVEILDDGGGQLTVSPRPAAGGHGLVGMRERVTVHGGTFDAGPKLGGGWRVTVQVPWT
jgi:signal transduction histidine kinase